MAKSGKNREIEYWKGLVRKLQKEIRELKKQHRRRFSKEVVLEWIDDEEEIVEPKKRKPTCPDCGKGAVTITDIGVRKLYRCDTCGWRKSEKNGG